MSLSSLIQLWRSEPETAPNFPIWKTSPARPSQTRPLPDDMPAGLREALGRQGIRTLYSHQLQAWEHARTGRNFVLATGTASGKTLAYNLPVIASLMENEAARALYLFPTKALSQDQLAALERSFNSMTESLQKLIAEQKEKQRIESELAIAQEVQALLFPRDIS